MRITSLLCLAGMVAAVMANRYGRMSIMTSGAGLMPRYLFDSSMPIEKRAGSCASGTHDCQDILHPDTCCANDQFCYVDSDFNPRCCPIGGNCPNNDKCNTDSFYCTSVLTLSASGSSSATGTGTGTGTGAGSRPTTTVVDGCCNRPCNASNQYQCAASFGSGCCSFNEQCQSGGQCVATATPSLTPVVTPVAQGCTTSQFKCADGDGCCNDGYSCTQVSGTGYCAIGTPTNASITHEGGGGGLSAGAKAGIAIGVVVGAGVIVGGLAWCFISRRREKRRAQTESQLSGSGGPGGGPGTDAMTEVTSAGRPPQGLGVTQDYFGPDALPGPFTTTDAHSTSGTPRAVPHQPHQPGDIAAPVEMDSESALGRSPLAQSPSSHNTGIAQQSPQHIDGRFELYGSEVPSPQQQQYLRELQMQQQQGTPSELSAPMTPRSGGQAPPRT